METGSPREARPAALTSEHTNSYASRMPAEKPSMTANAEKKVYQENWAVNSSHLAAQGCYEWMAEQLGELKPKRVFDIGCGTGEGLLALRRRFGCQVLSIDENPCCIQRAAALLRANDTKVQSKFRYHYLDRPNGRHFIGVEVGEIALSREVMLLQGDILLKDTELFRFVKSKAPFDAVTVWLTGAYLGRQSCIQLDDYNMKDITEYRLAVQNKVYELAATILRSGGLLQVVDRVEIPEDPALREELIESHRVQASVTDLEVQSLVFRSYEELSGTSGRGIRVVPMPGSSGRMPALFTWGLSSVLSSKP